MAFRIPQPAVPHHWPGVRLCLIGLLTLAGGCASSSNTQPHAPGATTRAVAPDDIASIPLDDIKPIPQMPQATPPTTMPSQPPVEALVLFAQARGALLDGRRFTAVGLLNRALKLDPGSFALHMALAQAQAGSSTGDEQAIAALTKAEAIRPDDLTVQASLGRQYLSKGDLDQAMRHLRLARQTPGYQRDNDDQSAVVDLLLAGVLQKRGYVRAALDSYDSLIRRLQHPNAAMRTNAQLMVLANRPQALYMAVGELHELQGNNAAALSAYQSAADQDPGDWSAQVRVIQTLLKMDRSKEAAERAVDLVRRFNASPESLALLNEVYGRIGRADDVTGLLRQLHADSPDDQRLLFALSAQLEQTGQTAEAARLLRTAAAAHPGNEAIMRRLFSVYVSARDLEGAARLLIEWSARKPNELDGVAELWKKLLQPGDAARIHLAQVRELKVSPDAEGAKWYWASRVALVSQRQADARAALERATTQRIAFAPAYHTLLAWDWDRDDWTAAQKTSGARKLASLAADHGDKPLAASLRGITAFREGNLDEAAGELEQAISAGDDSPTTQYIYAMVLKSQNKDEKSDRILWKLVSDYPDNTDGWSTLFRTSMSKGGAKSALAVLGKWLSADPTSVAGRLVQASVYLQANRNAAAQGILETLVREQSDNVEVLAMAQALYGRLGHLDQYTALLEELLKASPGNVQIVARLVDVYETDKRQSDALRILDAARAALTDDAGALYYLSHLYQNVGRTDLCEQVLEQALRLDPDYPPANNDLGYFWAEAGKNLDKAQELTQRAVKADPENLSFLDSLGWVLYKRGDFAASAKYLQAALGQGLADPVVLDHYGDVLYRLSRRREAMAQWQKSLNRLQQVGMERDDLKTLLGKLQAKLVAGRGDGPVDVAPSPGADFTHPPPSPATPAQSATAND